MTNIAGHRFDLRDRCTLTHHDGRVCGIRWLDIHDADDSCVGQLGWAHIGNLNAEELKQIRAERERRASIYDQAINGRWSEPEPVEEPGYLTMWIDEAAGVPEEVWEQLKPWGTQTRMVIDWTEVERW
jgi:hypothetical protein